MPQAHAGYFLSLKSKGSTGIEQVFYQVFILQKLLLDLNATEQTGQAQAARPVTTQPAIYHILYINLKE